MSADITDEAHGNYVGESSLDGYVVVLSSMGNVYVLKYDPEDSNLVLVRSTKFMNDDDGQEVFLPAGSYSCASIFSGSMPAVVFDDEVN